MLPREPGEGPGAADLGTLTPEETRRVTAAARAVLERIDAGESTLADLESVLIGETTADNGESAAPKPAAGPVW